VSGIGEATLWRWLQRPDFQEKYREARRKTVSQVTARLSQICGEAVEVLRGIMNDRNAPASNRVTASKIILETAIKAVEMEDLAGRIESLESVVSDQLQVGVR